MPAWIVIGLVTFLVGFLSNSLVSRRGFRWFLDLRRPRWLTFEAAIPFIWIFIFICAGASAYVVWQTEPGSLKTWLLMGGYLLLEVVTLAYTPVTIRLRNLKAGAIVGGMGAAIAFFLALTVFPISGWATLLLAPYVIWSPIGTYTTWVMVRLNP